MFQPTRSFYDRNLYTTAVGSLPIQLKRNNLGKKIWAPILLLFLFYLKVKSFFVNISNVLWHIRADENFKFDVSTNGSGLFPSWVQVVHSPSLSAEDEVEKELLLKSAYLYWSWNFENESCSISQAIPSLYVRPFVYDCLKFM